MSAWLDIGMFLADPLDWGLPERVAPLLIPGLRPDVVERLRRSPRLRARTSALLAARLGPGSMAALADVDRWLVLAPPELLAQVATIAGAIWHAPRVRSLVAARDVTAFVSTHGEAARTAALRHQALAPPPRAPRGSLDTDILHDGEACLAAWVADLPLWAAARLHLRWTPATPRAELDTTLRSRATSVIRLAAEAAHGS